MSPRCSTTPAFRRGAWRAPSPSSAPVAWCWRSARCSSAPSPPAAPQSATMSKPRASWGISSTNGRSMAGRASPVLGAIAGTASAVSSRATARPFIARSGSVEGTPAMRGSGWLWVPVLAVACAGAALAQSRDDSWARCRNANPDTGIEGCTAIIEAAGGTPRDRALAFNSRANARYRKGEYDRAVDDYDQAIKLDPNEPTAYDGRGAVYYSKGQYER